MEQTLYDQIHKMQQQVDRVDDNIAYKREILLRGIGDDGLKSSLRQDIRSLEDESRKLHDRILKLKLSMNPQIV